MGTKRGRTRNAGGTVRSIRARDRKCWLCGHGVSDSDASRDHVLPKALGGYNHAHNYRLAHGRCNSARGSLPVLEVRAVLDTLPVRAPMEVVIAALRIANKRWEEVNKVILAEARRGRQ